MTHLQKLIRNTVQADGFMHIKVGKGSPATMGTIKALWKAGYKCAPTGQHEQTAAVWIIEHPSI